MMKGKEKAIIPTPTKAEDKGHQNGFYTVYLPF